MGRLCSLREVKENKKGGLDNTYSLCLCLSLPPAEQYCVCATYTPLSHA